MCEEVVGLKHSLSSLTLLMSTPSSSFFTSQATRMERYGGNLSKLVAGRLQANVQQYRESPELSMSLETSASYRPAAAPGADSRAAVHRSGERSVRVAVFRRVTSRRCRGRRR